MHIRSLVPVTLAAALLTSAPLMAQEGAPTPPGSQMPSSPAPQEPGTTPGDTGAATGGSVTVGASVYDPQGKAVGIIEAVEAGQAVLSTGTVKVRVPVTSFAQSSNGLVISMTKEELEAAAGQAK